MSQKVMRNQDFVKKSLNNLFEIKLTWVIFKEVNPKR